MNFAYNNTPQATTTTTTTSSLLQRYTTTFTAATLHFPATNTPFARTHTQLICNAILKPQRQEYTEVIQNGLPLIKWSKFVEDDTEKDTYKVLETGRPDETETIIELVEKIKSMLKSMEDGEISVSPYDTAWVALVEDISSGATTNTTTVPQFPTSLDWISKNQLPDGSWGDKTIFLAHDRIINTLACVIALRSWNMHPDKSDKGIWFVKENIYKLEDENEEHMPIGFEVALPSLIEIAKNLNIDIPIDSPGLQEIYARRDLKLTKIPKEILHKVPTTLLHSLEGMTGLDWQKLLNLQSQDGSFLFSPSSTAFALQQTKDNNCLQYLSNQVLKFNGGVPNVYPVDLFEHMWAVDRLERLGISRYFQQEIEECIQYVHRYWTPKGISWARNSTIQDIDDTSMGFRLLRLHGYSISADVFKHFESDGEFFCIAGQSTQAVTGMYNLYRASQLMFPEENVLSDAKKFSSQFLQVKRANNELFDKWIITKDLPGEVGYALDLPWYASLPRVETRFYLEQYGGKDDVWIGKTLYRMPNVNNNTYLELAKLDYNYCQALHQEEWNNIQKWYKNCSIGESELSETKLLLAYYIAAANVYEKEKSRERLAWAKTAILLETIKSQQLSKEQKRAFVDEFKHGSSLKYHSRGRSTFVGTMVKTLSQLSLGTLLEHGRDVHQQLHNAWQKWLSTWEEEGDMGEGDAELIILTLSTVNGQSNSVLSHPKYQELLKIMSRACSRLRLLQYKKEQEADSCKNNLGAIMNVNIDSDMLELVKLVLTESRDDLESDVKKKFLDVARSFYYAAYCNQGTINFHIAKVLFERVL